MASLTTDAAADLVAATLTEAGLGDLVFTRARWPKYSLKDLKFTKAHCVPVWPAQMDPHDDASTAIETPIAVTIDAQCEKGRDDQVAELTELLEAIAGFLAATNVPGLGYPIQPLQIDRNEEYLDQGHFCGGVGVVYRRYREAEETA